MLFVSTANMNNLVYYSYKNSSSLQCENLQSITIVKIPRDNYDCESSWRERLNKTIVYYEQ